MKRTIRPLTSRTRPVVVRTQVQPDNTSDGTDREDSGVHLDEPSSPLPQRWLSNDLDDVVLQLSNPIHHVSKVPRTSTTSNTSTARTMTAGGAHTSSYSLSSTASTTSSYSYSTRTRSSGDCRCGGGGGGGSVSVSTGGMSARGRSSVDSGAGGGSGTRHSGVGVTLKGRSSSEISSTSVESSRNTASAGRSETARPSARFSVGSGPDSMRGGGGSSVGSSGQRSCSVEVVAEREDGHHLERDLHEKCRIHSTSSTLSNTSSSLISSSDKQQRTAHSWRDIKGSRTRQRSCLKDTLRNHRSLETDDPSSCTDYSSMVSNDDDGSNISKSSTISSLCSNLDIDEGCSDVNMCVRKSATTTVLNECVSFDCDSTPEISDNDVSEGGHPHQKVEEGQEAEGGVFRKSKEPKKRRFGKKMLPRPLRRSQSAGCAKDVPAHALFLQHSIGDKGIDTLEERLGRTVHSPARGEEDGEEEEWGRTRRPPPPHARPIHKTASADAAMMARDEYGNVSSQAKAKRSLAKTMKRKLMFLRRRHTDTTLGSVLKGDGKQVTKIQPEDALQWSRSFESLLTDKAGLELFRGFLRSEFSDENLEFWIACEDFKSVKPSKVPAVAQKIYTDFVAAQAPREINLDAKTRVKTLSNLDHPSKEIFEEAQRKVQALMEKDSYPRFLESEVYQRIIRSQKS